MDTSNAEFILAPPTAVFHNKPSSEKESLIATQLRSMGYRDYGTKRNYDIRTPESVAFPASSFLSPTPTKRGLPMTTPPSVQRHNTKRMRRSELCGDLGDVYPHLLVPIFDDIILNADAKARTKTNQFQRRPLLAPRLPYKLSIRIDSHGQSLSDKSNWNWRLLDQQEALNLSLPLEPRADSRVTPPTLKIGTTFKNTTATTHSRIPKVRSLFSVSKSRSQNNLSRRQSHSRPSVDGKMARRNSCSALAA